MEMVFQLLNGAMDELPSKTIILSITPEEDGSRIIKIDNWNNDKIDFETIK